MRILDLFCGAGGAAMGYHRAFPDAEIVGVDINPQPRYPFTFWQLDAIQAPINFARFDLIHASPPCQHYSAMSACRPGLADGYPDLVAEVRARLVASGVPYVIENVPGSPLVDPVTLCGQMFGLELYRHRLFEASFHVGQPYHPTHVTPASKAGHWAPGTIMSVAGHVSPIAKAREVMGIDWMNRAELGEAIPPAFTQYVGEQFAAWRTSRADARQGRHDTHHTTAHRCADGDVRPRTSRTAATGGDPSDRVQKVTHQLGVAVGNGTTDRVGVGSGEVTVGDMDGELAVNGGVTEGAERLGVLADGVGRKRHTATQPQTHEGVNHK